MYTEEARGSEKERKKGFFKIIVAFLITYVLEMILNAINIPYKIVFVVAVLVIMTYLIYRFVRHSMTKFFYTLSDDGITFSSKLGSKDFVIASVPLESIIKIEAISKGKGDDEKLSFISDARKKSGNCGYACIYKENKKRSCVKFDPSEKLIGLLSEKNVKVIL